MNDRELQPDGDDDGDREADENRRLREDSWVALLMVGVLFLLTMATLAAVLCAYRSGP